MIDNGYINLLDHMGTDETIANTARLSYAQNSNKSSDDKLIHILMKNDHMSPFEQVEFRFEVKAPIFVARQWMRYRTASYHEMSGRYSEMNPEFYIPTSDRMKSDNDVNYARIQKLNETIYKEYKELLEDGVKKELARTILPLSTFTTFIFKIDLRNLFHFLDQRTDKHAQFEIREYANEIANIVKEKVPSSYDAWKKYKNFN